MSSQSSPHGLRGASSATVDAEATAGEVDPISKSIIMFQRIFQRAPDSMEEIMRYYERYCYAEQSNIQPVIRKIYQVKIYLHLVIALYR